MSLTNGTTATFPNEVLASDKPVLVDFWAEWCGPCKQVAPVVAKFADQHAGSVDVVKIDIDANPSLARDFGIMSIPTLMFFKDGQPVKTIVGSTNLGALTAAAASL